MEDETLSAIESTSADQLAQQEETQDQAEDLLKSPHVVTADRAVSEESEEGKPCLDVKQDI